MADNNPAPDQDNLDVAQQLLGVAKEIRNILEQMSGITSRVADNTRRIQDSADRIAEGDITRVRALANQVAELNKQNAQLINISKGTFDIEKAGGKILGQRGKETVQLLKQNQLFQAIVGSLFLNSQLINDIEKGIGISYTNSIALRNEFVNVAGATNDIFVNSQNLQKSFFDLKTQAGVFFDISSQSAETFLNLTDRLGMAGSEAANLTTVLRLQGPATEETLSNLVDVGNETIKTSKTTATVKDLLNDAASASKGLQASLSANPAALVKSAAAARELGATLKDIEGIQGKLLDFESSISAELEAELLTGKQLNLEKARTAALNNDLETVGKELQKQGVDLASFTNMNALQQEKVAAAMGLSRDALGEMLMRQQTQNMTLDEVREKFGDQTYEQMKALSAQDKFNAATAKLKDLFTGVLTAFTPIIDLVAMIVKPIAFVAEKLSALNKFTGGFSNALIGALIIAKALRGSLAPKIMEPLIDKGKDLINQFKGVKDASSNIVFDERMKGGGRFRDLTSGRMVSEESANAAGVFKPGTGPTAAAASGVADASEGIGEAPAPPDDGENLKKKMQNIAEGIKSFADGSVLKGALNMVLSAPGIIALGLASLPLKITEKLNGKALESGMKGIARGVASFAQASAGILPLIGAAGALAIMTLGLPGLAGVALLGVPAAAGLTALTGGLTALGAAAATGIPFLGAALLAAFGVALIPFGAALGLAAPAIEAVGTVIATTIMSIANAVVTVMPILTQSLIDLATQIPIANLLALALSLPSLAFGVGLLGGALLISAPGLVLGSLTLPLIAPAIAQLGEALTNIDTTAFFQFGIGMAALTAAFTLAGVAYPLIIGGSLALSVALIPLTAVLAAAAPIIETFSNSIIALSELNTGGLLQLAGTLPLLALGIGSLALAVGAAVIAAVSLRTITSALEPLAEIAPKLTLTDQTLKNIAASARTLAESLSGLNVSPLFLLSQISGKIGNLKNVFSSIGEGITSMGGIIKGKLLNAGEGVKNFFNGLKGKFAAVGEAAKGKFAEIKETLSPTVESNFPPRAEQTSPGEDMSNIISDNVRAAVIEAIREKLPSGEFKVTTIMQDLNTGETTTSSATSTDLGIAERKAELQGRVNLIEGTNITPSPQGFQPIAAPNVGAGPGEAGAPTVQQGTTTEEIEGIVSTTIKALVPEMVAALKEGQGNIKVTNDNFNASSQGELPSQIRNITNNMFA